MFLFNIKIILYGASIFVFSEAALGDKFKKCSIKDETCLKGFFQSVYDTMTNYGVPELDIEKTDPLNVEEVSVEIPGLLNLKLSEGTIEGLRSCEIINFISDFDNRKYTLHFLCDKVIIFGAYKLELFGTLLNTLTLGVKNTHGNGDGKIIADKVDICLEYPFYFKKKADGVYLKLDSSNMNYTFDILEKATFEVDNLIDGDPAASKKVIMYMNDNWKLILHTFVTDFFDKVIQYANLVTGKIFRKVSTQYFIIEDLSPYIKE